MSDMEKYAVDENEENEENDEQEKKATHDAGLCPSCGSQVALHGHVRVCPNCGTKPFERKDSE